MSAPQSTKVIVRYTSEAGNLFAGAVGYVRVDENEPLLRFIPVRAPIMVGWGTHRHFLPVVDFLGDVDRSNFVTLQNISRRRRGESSFVADPRGDGVECVFGSNPFPFESEGEALFWCFWKTYDIDNFKMRRVEIWNNQS